MWGINTNEYGETNIQGLLAFGECACTEVHGANRLASNSVLESAVFSSLGAFKAKKYRENEMEVLEPRKEVRFCEVDWRKLEELEVELRNTMWDYVGILRNDENLGLMLRKLRRLRKKIDDFNGNGM